MTYKKVYKIALGITRMALFGLFCHFLYSNLDSIYLRDIITRLGVNEMDYLNCVMRYMIKHLGEYFSLYNLADDLIEMRHIQDDKELIIEIL